MGLLGLLESIAPIYSLTLTVLGASLFNSETQRDCFEHMDVVCTCTAVSCYHLSVLWCLCARQLAPTGDLVCH